MNKAKTSLYSFFKSFWPFFAMFIIVITFFLNIMIAIWMTFIFLLLSVILYLPSLSLNNRVINIMTKHLKIEDKELAIMANKTLTLIKEVMHDLSLKQKRREWLIVSLNNRYIFYNAKIINIYKQLYYRGFTDKQAYESLSKTANLKTRSEVKAIENTLKVHDRLLERDLLIKKKPLNVDTYPQPIKKLGKI